MYTNKMMNIFSDKIYNPNNKVTKECVKQVRFASIVYIILIPCIKEYKAADIHHDIWGPLNPSNLVRRNSHLDIVSESR